MKEEIVLRLATQKMKLGDVPIPDVDESIKDLLADPKFPFRTKEEIPFIRMFSVQEKAVTKGLQYGQIRHWISTTAIDTYGEVMLPKGAETKYYKKNPMVLWSHDYREPENVMGRNIEMDAYDKGIVSLTQFAMTEPKASQVYRLYQGDYLRAWSVGFIPLKGKKPNGDKESGKSVIIIGSRPDPTKVSYIHTKWRLLEYSAVAVPANPDALTITVAKSLNIDEGLIGDLQLVADKATHEAGKKAVIDLGGGKKDDPEEKERKKKEADEIETKTEEAEKTLKAFAKMVGYQGELDYLSHVKSDCGWEMMSTVGKPKGERIFYRLPNLPWREKSENFECPFCDDEGNLLSLADFEWDSAEEVDPETFRKEYEKGVPCEVDEEMRPYPNEHACRLRNPGDFQKGSFRRYSRTTDGKTYGVIAGRLKGKTKMTEQSFRYPKDSWEVGSARSHCKSHNGILFEPASGKVTMTQELYEGIREELLGLKDEIAAVRSGKVLSAKNLQTLNETVTEMNEAATSLTAASKRLRSLIDSVKAKPEGPEEDEAGGKSVLTLAEEKKDEGKKSVITLRSDEIPAEELTQNFDYKGLAQKIILQLKKLGNS